MWSWKLLVGILGVLAGLEVLQHPLWSPLLLPSIFYIILDTQGIVLGETNLVMAFPGRRVRVPTSWML